MAIYINAQWLGSTQYLGIELTYYCRRFSAAILRLFIARWSVIGEEGIPCLRVCLPDMNRPRKSLSTCSLTKRNAKGKRENYVMHEWACLSIHRIIEKVQISYNCPVYESEKRTDIQKKRIRKTWNFLSMVNQSMVMKMTRRKSRRLFKLKHSTVNAYRHIRWIMVYIVFDCEKSNTTIVLPQISIYFAFAFRFSLNDSLTCEATSNLLGTIE